MGVKRTGIRELVHGSKDFLLVAVMISKQSPRTLGLTKSSGNF